jgi:hypothetical protein
MVVCVCVLGILFDDFFFFFLILGHFLDGDHFTVVVVGHGLGHGVHLVVEVGRHEVQSERESGQNGSEISFKVTGKVGDLDNNLQDKHVEPLESHRILEDLHVHVFHHAHVERAGDPPDTVDHLQEADVDGNLGEGHHKNGDRDDVVFGRVRVEARLEVAAQEELHESRNGQDRRVEGHASLEVASAMDSWVVGGVGMEGPDHKGHGADECKGVHHETDDSHGTHKLHVRIGWFICEGNEDVLLDGVPGGLADHDHFGDVANPCGLDHDHQEHVEVLVAVVVDGGHVSGEDSGDAKDKDKEAADQSPHRSRVGIVVYCPVQSKPAGDVVEGHEDNAHGQEHKQSTDLSGVGLEAVGGYVELSVFGHGGIDLLVWIISFLRNTIDFDFDCLKIRFVRMLVSTAEGVSFCSGFFTRSQSVQLPWLPTQFDGKHSSFFILHQKYNSHE